MEDKLLPVLKHGFLRSEEMLTFTKFQHLWYMSAGVSCNFMDTVVWWPHAMVDVITIVFGRCYALDCGRYYCQFDIYLLQMVGHWGRCYSLCAEQMADDIAIVIDGKET